MLVLHGLSIFSEKMGKKSGSANVTKASWLAGIVSVLGLAGTLIFNNLEGISAFGEWIGFNPSEIFKNSRQSPTEAVLELRQFTSYAEARKSLLESGWQPKEIALSEFDKSQIHSRFNQDVPEIQHCSGTGLGYCSGELQSRNGETLKITTAGMPPGLISWDVDTLIKPETAIKAVNQLIPGVPYEKVKNFLVSEGWQSRFTIPQYIINSHPEVPSDFIEQFPSFQECQVKDEIVQSCNFVFYAVGERRLIVTTDIKKAGSVYEALVREWRLEPDGN